MIDFFSPDATAVVREVITETLLVFDIALLLFIAQHLRNEVAVIGWRATRAKLGNQAAMAMAIHFIGLTAIRGWNTLQYVLRDYGIDADAIEAAYPVALVGLVIALIGMACCIRIFSPIRWGNWGWVLTFMAALGIVGFLHAG